MQNIKSRMSAELSQEQIIDNVANEISRQNGLEISFVKNRLNQLFAEDTNTIGPNAIDNIRSFFIRDGLVDGIAYAKTKKLVRTTILENILSGPGYLVRSDAELNSSLKAVIKTTKRYSGYTDDIISPLVNYLSIEFNKDEYFKSPNLLANYLIINHLPTVIQSWFKDIIHYNTNTGLYEFNVKHKIRQDYIDTDDKEAELNAMLEIMLQATPICKFNTEGEVEHVFQNRTLNRNALFAAISEELKVMPEDVYINYLSNPYSLLDYLINKYSNTGAHAELYQNIMHSFIEKWISSEGIETTFFENSKKQLSESYGFNPLDIFLKSFDKYRVNKYIEYNLSDKTHTLSLALDENSAAYGKLSDYISSRLLDLDNPVFKGIFYRDSNNVIKFNSNVDAETLSEVSDQLFGEHVDVDQNFIQSFKNAIQQIVDFKNQSKEPFFADFLQQLQGKEKRAKHILVILNKINAYNPYIIKGSAKNVLDKALPMIGLSSVAGTIQDQIYRNKIRKEQVNQTYQEANLPVPVSPFEQTTLFRHKKNAEDNMFLGTVYRSTMQMAINNEDVIKDVGSLSNPEAFKLAFIEDFWKGWNSSSDEIIRIQAITPSDKPRIPFFEFSSIGVKNAYGRTNSEIESNVTKELRNIYAQNLTNTLLDFAAIFNLSLDSFNIDPNASNNTIDNLLEAVAFINTYLYTNNITEDIINQKVFQFNKNYQVNKNIAKVHDYIVEEKTTIINNEKIKKSFPTISPYMVESVKLLNSTNGLDTLYKEFLTQLSTILPVIELDKKNIINVKELLDQNGELNNKAKLSPLYTYFLIKNVLGENILVNTVGTPLSHKNKGGDYLSMDSDSHLTMVKRMVALTATMHSCMPNVLSGLSNQINTMTIDNESAEMYAYSGNASSGKGFTTKLVVDDGAMRSCRFVANMLKQSITDVKPKGNDLKLLLHSLDPEKGFATLAKLADYVIDNNWLRTFADENLQYVGGINLLALVQLSLQGVSINPNFSVNEDGEIVDYDGNPIIELDDIYTKENGIIYNITNVKYNAVNNTIEYDKYNTETNEGRRHSANNDLYEIWTKVLGAQYSCDENGEYGEQSMDMMTVLLNKLGRRLPKNNSIDSQDNIDQYAKKAIVHYFPTASVQKSAQAPIVNIREALRDPNKRYTSKVYIENLGIQLDPDHSAEDGEIHEITQLISFITEGNFVPDKVKQVYQNLGKMITILKEKTFVSLDAITDETLRKQVQSKLDNLFGKKIERIFADPTLDVMGLANELMREIQKVSSEINYKAPYSDHQMLGKLHTTVGSYFNKFIARMWSGRGDVLVPSHNTCMLYEDDLGIKYLANDFKYLEDGTKVNIREYLRNQVWVNGYGSTLRDDYIASHLANAYEIMPVDVYYRIDPITRQSTPIVMDTWNKINTAREEILEGIQYVKAIDLPRNLRSKQAFIDIIIKNGQRRIGMYHFKTMQEIAQVSELLTSMDKNESIEFNQQTYTYDALFKHKKDLQVYFNEVVLPAISNLDTNVIQSELPFITEPIETFSYIIKEEERLTTNNYSNVFGISNMNYSEIAQKKEKYFKEHLINKFQEFTLPYDYLMYSANGKPTAIITNPELIDTSKYKPSLPTVDEDGYRLDADGNKLYIWPDNAKLYKYNYGNIVIEMIYTDNNGLDKLLDDGPFVFYRSNNILRKPNLYNLNSANIDTVLNRVARKQYLSWQKSNEAVMSRIPAQSLSFAMVINTVGYLPWSNNVTMVPNMNVFLEGSD